MEIHEDRERITAQTCVRPHLDEMSGNHDLGRLQLDWQDFVTRKSGSIDLLNHFSR